MTDASDTELTHKFIYGLNTRIQQAVLMQSPIDLSSAQTLAIAAEDINQN